MLDSTVESVNSALKRARASLQRRLPPIAQREPPPAPDSPSEQALVAKFARAYESGDINALVALLTNDIFVSMPPYPFEYQGRDVVARFFASIFNQGRTYDLVPTRRMVSWRSDLPSRSHRRQRPGAGLLVLTLSGDRICAITRFEHPSVS